MDDEEEVRTLADYTDHLDGNDDLDGFIVSDGHLSKGEHNSDIDRGVMAGLAESDDNSDKYIYSLSL